MSSKESDDDGDEVLTIFPLPWRAANIDTPYNKLDETLKIKIFSSSEVNKKTSPWC